MYFFVSKKHRRPINNIMSIDKIIFLIVVDDAFFNFLLPFPPTSLI